MSIVPAATIKIYVDISDANYTAYGSAIHLAIEQYITDTIGLDFVAATFANEVHDGYGQTDLLLRHKPINYVSRVAIGRQTGIKVKNTFTDTTTAIVRVDATNCTLIVDGGAGNSSNALALATYTTLTLLVAAINALSAYGWSAEVYDSDLASIKTAIIPPQTVDCTIWDGETANWKYLDIAGRNVDYEVYNSEGRLHRDSGFGYGNNNVIVSYNAEETPADITYLICQMTGILADAKAKGNLDVSRWRVGEIEMQYGTIRELMPPAMQAIMEGYISRMVRI